MPFQLIEMGVRDNRGPARAVTEKITPVTFRAAAVLQGGGKQMPKAFQSCGAGPVESCGKLAELAFDPVVVEGTCLAQ